MRRDPLAGEYKLKCEHPGCHGGSVVRAEYGVGWEVGSRVPMDPSTPAFGRCPVCKRYSMVVVDAPKPPPPPGPKGFTKVPTQ